MSIRIDSVLMITAFLFTSVVFAQKTATYQVGPLPDGGFAVPTNQVVTPAGIPPKFSGRPLAIAVRPDHKIAAVLNTGSGENNFATRFRSTR
jgi:hypothetical protein